MDIRALLAAPESKTLEFKENLSSLVPIMKTIIAFANTAGGILIIGRSSQGQLVGVNDVFKAEEALANAISDCIHPTILPEIEIITVEGKNLLVVQVSHWKAPFYLKKDGIPRGIYIRLGSTNRPATPELMAELNRSPLTQSFDQEPVVELEKKDLDLEKIDVTFSKVGKKISEENLRSLDILVPYANRLVPSIGGILLFGRPQCRQHLVPNATVSCARFSGTSKSQMLDRFDVKGTLLDAIEEVPKFIARNTHQSSVIKGFLREEIPEYPTIAVREALVNAIAHADYSLPGSCIQVAIFDDRLEIQNPGMFPFGLT